MQDVDFPLPVGAMVIRCLSPVYSSRKASGSSPEMVPRRKPIIFEVLRGSCVSFDRRIGCRFRFILTDWWLVGWLNRPMPFEAAWQSKGGFLPTVEIVLLKNKTCFLF